MWFDGVAHVLFNIQFAHVSLDMHRQFLLYSVTTRHWCFPSVLLTEGFVRPHRGEVEWFLLQVFIAYVGTIGTKPRVQGKCTGDLLSEITVPYNKNGGFGILSIIYVSWVTGTDTAIHAWSDLREHCHWLHLFLWQFVRKMKNSSVIFCHLWIIYKYALARSLGSHMKNDTCTLSLTTCCPSAAAPVSVLTHRVSRQSDWADGLEIPVPTSMPHLWQGHRDMCALPSHATRKSSVQFVHAFAPRWGKVTVFWEPIKNMMWHHPSFSVAICKLNRRICRRRLVF